MEKAFVLIMALTAFTAAAKESGLLGDLVSNTVSIAAQTAAVALTNKTPARAASSNVTATAKTVSAAISNVAATVALATNTAKTARSLPAALTNTAKTVVSTLAATTNAAAIPAAVSNAVKLVNSATNMMKSAAGVSAAITNATGLIHALTNALKTAAAAHAATNTAKAVNAAQAILAPRPATNALPAIKLLSASEFRIRDPFIFADEKTGLYYLYSTFPNDGDNIFGVMAYTSKDLKKWTPPVPVLTFTNNDVTALWAPEVHFYNGRYYLFATLTSKERVSVMASLPSGEKWPSTSKRGTWIYSSLLPCGPFTALRDSSFTPQDWMALDGTLIVDDGKPYMAFCHEWVQIIDGTICLQELSPDLTQTVGDPKELLAASSAIGAKTGYKEEKVTDGPFFYRSALNDSLYMIWSTFLKESSDYCVMATRSPSGSVLGPWSPSRPIYVKNGGHAMIFKAFDGKTLIALHQPNTSPMERLHLYELFDDGTILRIVPHTTEP